MGGSASYHNYGYSIKGPPHALSRPLSKKSFGTPRRWACWTSRCLALGRSWSFSLALQNLAAAQWVQPAFRLGRKASDLHPAQQLLWVKHDDGPVRKLARHRWRSAGTSFQSMLPLRKLFVSVRQTPSCMARSCQLVWMEAGLAFIMTCHRLLAAYPQHAMELIRLHESVSSFAGMHLHCEKRSSRRPTF